MRKLYIFPLVGAIITLFGLCFPVVLLFDGITIWSWGFYTVEQKSLALFRISYEKEFETFLRSTLILGFCFFIFIFLSLTFIIQTSLKLKKKQISMRDAKRRWDSRSFTLIASLVSYMIYMSMTMKPQDVYYKNGIFIQFLGGFICLIPSFSRLKKHIYKINKYLTLKLKNDETVIYIAGQPFEICKHLIINIPVEQVNDIESIDEVVDGYGEDIEYRFYTHEVELTPKEIFKGHCSNLQVWAENGYDTCLLGSNLAFPLLKRLTEVGDLKASSVFKDEIRKRFGSLYAPVQQYLICEGYLKYFSKSERQEMLKCVLSIDTWVLIGENYFLNSLHEEVIEAYEYALEIDPINKVILKKLCYLSIIVGDYQRAFKYYNSLSEFYELKNHDYLTLDDIYNEPCQHSNAKRMYWDALELNSSETRAWIKLSELFQREGKIYLAIEILKQGLKHSPLHMSLLFRLRLLYKSNKNYWNYIKTTIVYYFHKKRKKILAIFKKDLSKTKISDD